MSNLSANAQLLGNLEHTTAELLEGMTEERGRGFASDNESWAALKGYLERAEKMRKDIEKVHKEMWDAIKDQNDDAYGRCDAGGRERGRGAERDVRRERTGRNGAWDRDDHGGDHLLQERRRTGGH